MIIRKLFKFENAHIVRNCSSDRCKYSVHGHSYRVEVLLSAHGLDNGQMVYDFGLLKGNVKEIIDSFDHATTIWDKDDSDYIASMKKHSARWITMPVSPSAEQFARVFFVLNDAILNNTVTANGEADVEVHSVIVHETDTGYAQAFRFDVNPEFSHAVLHGIEFSDAVKDDWSTDIINNIKDKIPFQNPVVQQQVLSKSII